MKRYLRESTSGPGFALIKPSIERWIMDRFDENYPQTLSDVNDYVNMQDKDYHLCTNMGDYLAKDIMNAYLQSNVSWLETRFDLNVSKLGKLGILYRGIRGITIILHYIQYDFSKSFMSNLGRLTKETADFLNKDYSSEQDFKASCMTASQDASNKGKKTIYLDFFNDNPNNMPVFESDSLLKYIVLTKKDEVEALRILRRMRL